MKIYSYVLMGLSLMLALPASGTLLISRPSNGQAVGSTVTISASAKEGAAFHLEVWDNGRKLGNFFSNSVNTSAVLTQGRHTMTVQAVSPMGHVLDRSTVVYSVSVQKAPVSAPAPLGPATVPPAPAAPAAPDNVAIASPTPGSTSVSAVRIAASVNGSIPSLLEIWDNGYKLGAVSASNVDGVYVLPSGSHVLTVRAVDTSGSVLSQSSVSYTVAENCSNSTNAQCDLDQIAMNNVQNDCNPALQIAWVANGCGSGVQGVNPVFPQSTLVAAQSDGGSIPDQGNLTLNGKSLHVAEVQGSQASNVLFRGQSPTSTSTRIDSHWTMDEYVYLPNPSAHQAFEMDAQYTGGKIWSKFYTECAFNMNNGTGYWAVFDSETGGWIFLNGKIQNGQTPPVVPCNRSQFAQPWPGSSNPSFTGWHHIAWTFLRNSDGTVTFQTLTFDATTTKVNFTPNSLSGGLVGDAGNFDALIQLDGVENPSGLYSLVDAYVSEVNLTHTP
ncbi:MAG: hypothetical protein HIU91_15400 [Acidobacteria bacterium]|nr:hypothetical protein [Acidobacteriota bacterium]